MTWKKRAALLFALVGMVCPGVRGATFGTVVPIGGHASDICLQELRGRLYVANFTANRIEVLDTATNTLLAPILVTPQPSALACSPDGRYVVVGHYDKLGTRQPAVTVIDLQTNAQTVFAKGSSPLAIAFGSSNLALIASNTGFELFHPAAGTFTPLVPALINSQGLPVPFATFPPEIIQASAGVSGDGNTIYVFAQAGPTSLLAEYHVGDGIVSGVVGSSPDLGPAVVSVDRDGATFLAGWALLRPMLLPNRRLVLMAQFPYATGRANLGSHVWDDSRNLIYANAPTTEETRGGPSTLPAPGQDGPVLTILDSDNLTVRERIRLPESLAGKSLLSSDRQVMYSISDSGIMILPIGALDQTHRVTAVEEDMLFTSNACDRGVIAREVNIVNPGGGRTDFTLSTTALGVRISPSSGATPARVRIEVDPTVYQNQTGTTAVPVEIRSSSAINLPMPVRLLINTRQPGQKGVIVNIPGKLLDILADPVRDRFYVLRQDKNQVLVFDGTNFAQIATLRTGNTPVQMAITREGSFLIVTNDNSQIGNVYGLSTLTPAGIIVFPPGHYPRSIAVSNNAILATTRVAGPVHTIDRITSLPSVFGPGFADKLPSLGIYENNISQDTVLTASPSGENIFLAMPDGTLALYEGTADTFVASRKDLGNFSGAYAALTNQLFVVDNQVVNWSLVPITRLESDTGSSSGFIFSDGFGLRTTSKSASSPGVIQRVDLTTFNSVRPIPMAESPLLSASMRTTPIGQIGQTILPFTRTLAPLSNRVSIVSLTTSGLTVLPWDFAAAQPIPLVDRIVNSADQQTGVAPGGLISIFGSGFAAGTTAANTLPLPTTLGDLCVSANGVAVPLLTVSPNRIEAQLSFNVIGSASLVVNASGGSSSPFSFTSLAGAPAIFRTGTAGPLTGLPTVYRATNNELVTLTNPIHPKDIIVFFVTGLGLTLPAVASGAAAPSDPLAVASLGPLITLGGEPLSVTFAGLIPGLVGVYQINAFVPETVPEGLELPLTIRQGTFATTLSVRVVK